MPEIKTQEPLKYPLRSSIASRSAMPLKRARSKRRARPADVIGITTMPAWSMIKDIRLCRVQNLGI
jgi:hypothetical protein